MKTRIIIANFKNYLSFEDERFYLDHLANLQTAHNIQLLIAPSLINVTYAAEVLKGKHIVIGQMCSPLDTHIQTGGILAHTLASAGAHGVLIGHSETRALYNWQYQDLFACVQKAIKARLQPIICIGEAQLDNDDELRVELRWLEETLALTQAHNALIAYEPTFAIGGDTPVTKDYLKKRVLLMREYIPKLPILYGGSVTSASYHELSGTGIDGFLIGRASTHFQELEKIVSL